VGSWEIRGLAAKLFLSDATGPDYGAGLLQDTIVLKSLPLEEQGPDDGALTRSKAVQPSRRGAKQEKAASLQKPAQRILFSTTPRSTLGKKKLRKTKSKQRYPEKEKTSAIGRTLQAFMFAYRSADRRRKSDHDQEKGPAGHFSGPATRPSSTSRGRSCGRPALSGQPKPNPKPGRFASLILAALKRAAASPTRRLCSQFRHWASGKDMSPRDRGPGPSMQELDNGRCRPAIARHF